MARQLRVHKPCGAYVPVSMPNQLTPVISAGWPSTPRMRAPHVWNVVPLVRGARLAGSCWHAANGSGVAIGRRVAIGAGMVIGPGRFGADGRAGTRSDTAMATATTTPIA